MTGRTDYATLQRVELIDGKALLAKYRAENIALDERRERERRTSLRLGSYDRRLVAEYLAKIEF